METAFFDHQGKKKRTIYDADLNFDRTRRIYKTLNNLSDKKIIKKKEKKKYKKKKK
jgi:predicted transcriptional regulator